MEPILQVVLTPYQPNIVRRMLGFAALSINLPYFAYPDFIGYVAMAC